MYRLEPGPATLTELAGKHLKRVVLELGVKAPMPVLRDAVIDHAVDAAVFGTFMNQGQISCRPTAFLSQRR